LSPVVWGPYAAGDGLLLATASSQLLFMQPDGGTAWSQPIEKGEPIGEPLVSGEDVLLVSRQGVLEKRSLADGGVGASVDTTQSIAAGPVAFGGRIVLATNDGALLILNRP
jgi:hypothetical protein